MPFSRVECIHWANILKYLCYTWNVWPNGDLNFSFFFYCLFVLFCLFYFLTLQYCIGFAIYQHESATGIHVFPILNPPPTSIPVPSLWVIPVHQPQASSIMHRTILYKFQCHSPKSSHPLPLPQSPKDCSIHQCLPCYPVHRVIITIPLNSIYMR